MEKKLPLKNINEDMWKELLSSALYKELQKNHVNVKNLAHWTGVSERTVKNWLEKRFMPDSLAMIRLMQHSSFVRQIVLTQICLSENLKAAMFVCEFKKFSCFIRSISERLILVKQASPEGYACFDFIIQITQSDLVSRMSSQGTFLVQAGVD